MQQQQKKLRVLWITPGIAARGQQIAGSYLLSVFRMKRSSSSQKCSGIPSDSISAKLSPNTWPTQGYVTDLCVSLVGLLGI